MNPNDDPRFAGTAAVVCSQCGRRSTAHPGVSAIACPFCGRVNEIDLGPMGTATLARPRCTRTTYVVLGLLLGGFGAHNFAAGRTKRGLAQLLITTCLFWMVFPVFAVGVWVLVDLLTVRTDVDGTLMA
jgi:TM2 domain-containing membrane protein YozV